MRCCVVEPRAERVACNAASAPRARSGAYHGAMFGRWLSRASSEPLEGAESLVAVVRAELPGADAETVRVVTAIAGLLAAVAYADRDFSEAEDTRLRAELGRIDGMTEDGVRAIAAALRKHVVEIATVQVPRYARVLVDLADRELRKEVLESLVELSAADGEITHAETNVLRQLTTSLGLSQADYNEAQQHHRERLAVLRRES